MINVVILDDEKEQVDELKKLCFEYFIDKKIKCKIRAFTNTDDLMENSNMEIDLLLLDIEMPNHNGLRIAHKVRMTNKKCFICFVTNYSDYIFESYDVHAFDYILKPVNKERLYVLLNEVIKYREVTNYFRDERLVFNTAEGEVIVNQNDILYFEYYDKYNYSHNRVTLLHTVKKNYVLKEKIKDILQKVEQNMFVSPHKSFIISMDHIKQISKNSIIMQNNVEIPLSQKKSAEVRKKFSQYIHNYYEEI